MAISGFYGKAVMYFSQNVNIQFNKLEAERLNTLRFFVKFILPSNGDQLIYSRMVDDSINM